MRRAIRTVLVPLLVGYVLLCSCVAALQRKLTYFPSDAVTMTPAQYGMPAEDVRLATDDGVELAAWWIPAEDARGAVLLCHGNGGNRANVLPIARALYERDFHVLAFDYRGYGGNAGKPSEDGLRSDARAAYDFVASRGVPADRVLAYGHSLGAAVAVGLAEQRAVGALVLENGFRSLTAIASDLYPWLPVSLLIRDTWNSAERLQSIRVPVFVARGAGDTMIGAEHSEALADAANTQVHTFDGDHNTSALLSFGALAALDRFLDRQFPREGLAPDSVDDGDGIEFDSDIDSDGSAR